MALDSGPPRVHNFAQLEGGPDAAPGLAAAGRGGRVGFQPRSGRGGPGGTKPSGGGAFPAGPVAAARRGGGAGAGSQERASPRRRPPRLPPRRRGGSRTYRVGLRRRPGVSAGRDGQARGGEEAGGGGQRAAERDARPRRRPQPLPGSLTPAAGRPERTTSPSVRRRRAGRGRRGQTRRVAPDGVPDKQTGGGWTRLVR